MQYNTMFNTVHKQEFNLPCDSDIVRPDLSFSIKEIKEKFTLQHLIAANKNVQDNYLLSPDSNEFDSAPAEVPQNYDLVNAYADSNRLYNARKSFVDSIRNRNKNAMPSVEQSNQEISSNTSAES